VNAPRTFLAKIQVPLNGPGPALVYDENRELFVHVPTTPALHAFMGGKPKLFAHVRVEHEHLHIDGPAPWQEW
jgi:hypothetical protein